MNRDEFFLCSFEDVIFLSKDLRRLDFFGSFLCQDKNEQSFIELKNLILKLRNRQKENQLEQTHSKQLHYTSARVSST